MTVNTFLAGWSQMTFRDGRDVDHPAALMGRAALAALADAGLSAAEVDCLACVEPLSWGYADLPAAVMDAMGCAVPETVWVPAGGSSPQDLLHRISEEIEAGAIHCAVITGSEAMRTRRRAIREHMDLPWPVSARPQNPMRGQPPYSSPFEQQHGLYMPIQSFPLFENALRHANGRSASEQIAIAADILAKNAIVAADNPHAWFRDAPTAREIAEVTADNRMIAYPYTKRMNAIMDVDQAAAVVVLSGEKTRKLGLTDRSAAVLGGAGAEDAWFTVERATYSSSPAMHVAFSRALGHAGMAADEIDATDLYSCFPSAVQLALEALGTDISDPRPFTITGGLAYAGGPGNAYVMHALAAAVARLRSRREEKLLITGLGMAGTKHTATVLAAASQVPPGATGAVSYREEVATEPCTLCEHPEGRQDAEIVTWTMEYDRDGTVTNVIYVIELADGCRTLANAGKPAAVEAELLSRDPIGRRGRVVHNTAHSRNEFAMNRD